MLPNLCTCECTARRHKYLKQQPTSYGGQVMYRQLHWAVMTLVCKVVLLLSVVRHNNPEMQTPAA